MMTRENPSTTYQKRVELFSQLGKEGYDLQAADGPKKIPADQVFTGLELLQYVNTIKKMVDKHKAKELLEYGCGKGQQYKTLEPKEGEPKPPFKDLKSFWEVDNVTCFDSFIPEHNKFTNKKVDGVICINNLQLHNPEDLSWIVRELFSKADKFVFINVLCYPVVVQLPDRMLFHGTVRNPMWWAGFVSAIANDFPDIEYALGTVVVGSGADGRQAPQQSWAGRIAK